MVELLGWAGLGLGPPASSLSPNTPTGASWNRTNFLNFPSTISAPPSPCIQSSTQRVYTRVFTTAPATTARVEATQTPTNCRTETPRRLPPCAERVSAQSGVTP